jgi:hypothetical protein
MRRCHSCEFGIGSSSQRLQERRVERTGVPLCRPSLGRRRRRLGEGSEAGGAATRSSAEQARTEVTLHDGTHVLVRPIHAEDIALERRFIEALSPSSRRYRFLETMRSPSEALLQQMIHINPASARCCKSSRNQGNAFERCCRQFTDAAVRRTLAFSSQARRRGRETRAVQRRPDAARTYPDAVTLGLHVRERGTSIERTACHRSWLPIAWRDDPSADFTCESIRSVQAAIGE